jgi:hypothetical protein
MQRFGFLALCLSLVAAATGCVDPAIEGTAASSDAPYDPEPDAGELSEEDKQAARCRVDSIDRDYVCIKCSTRFSDIITCYPRTAETVSQ